MKFFGDFGYRFSVRISDKQIFSPFCSLSLQVISLGCNSFILWSQFLLLNSGPFGVYSANQCLFQYLGTGSQSLFSSGPTFTLRLLGVHYVFNRLRNRDIASIISRQTSSLLISTCKRGCLFFKAATCIEIQFAVFATI